MKEKIIEYLMTELSSVYCYNCENDINDDKYDLCEWCYRKNMNWSISSNLAENLADSILKLIKENPDKK